VLYVIHCIDKPDSLALRMATREAHLAYARDTKLVQFRAGGPFFSPEGTMVGSMLIVESNDPERVREFSANDPYGKAGLFAKVDVRPWKVTVGSIGIPSA
jgi:uncharacterized protein YciI